MKSAPNLEETLTWFAKTLRQPIGEESRLPDSSLSDQAEHFIAPSPTLKSRSRIELYAQQYWWRLFNTLHDQYPVTTRLFGYSGFNELIATPYMLKHPSTHWNINYLGRTLPHWIEAEYRAPDAPLVLASAKIDWAYIESFLAAEAPLPGAPEETLYLSPTTFLFELKWDLFTFRKELLTQDPNWWVDHDFPSLKKERTYYYLLRRNAKKNIAADEISKDEFRLLQQFEKGLSLNDLCDQNDNTALLEEAIPRWISQRLLTPEKPTS